METIYGVSKTSNIECIFNAIFVAKDHIDNYFEPHPEFKGQIEKLLTEIESLKSIDIKEFSKNPENFEIKDLDKEIAIKKLVCNHPEVVKKQLWRTLYSLKRFSDEFIKRGTFNVAYFGIAFVDIETLVSLYETRY